MKARISISKPSSVFIYFLIYIYIYIYLKCFSRLKKKLEETGAGSPSPRSACDLFTKEGQKCGAVCSESGALFKRDDPGRGPLGVAFFFLCLLSMF